MHIVGKSNKMSHFLILAFSSNFFLSKVACLVTLFYCNLQIFKNTLNWLFLAFYTNFCPIKNDLSGNTYLTARFSFSKKRQSKTFLAFLMNFCKRSSLRSQCWMRLFLWFSNTVIISGRSLEKTRNRNYSQRWLHDPRLPALAPPNLLPHHGSPLRHQDATSQPRPRTSPGNQPRTLQRFLSRIAQEDYFKRFWPRLSRPM